MLFDLDPKISLKIPSLKLMIFIRFYPLLHQQGILSHFSEIAHLGEDIQISDQLHFFSDSNDQTVMTLLSPFCPIRKATVSEQEFQTRIQKKIYDLFGPLNWNKILLKGDYLMGILEGRSDEMLGEMKLSICGDMDDRIIMRWEIHSIYLKLITIHSENLFVVVVNQDLYTKLTFFIPGEYPIHIRSMFLDSDEDSIGKISSIAYDGQKLIYSKNMPSIISSRSRWVNRFYRDWKERMIRRYLRGYHSTFYVHNVHKIIPKIQTMLKNTNNPRYYPKRFPMRQVGERKIDYRRRARGLILGYYYKTQDQPKFLHNYGMTCVRDVLFEILPEKYF